MGGVDTSRNRPRSQQPGRERGAAAGQSTSQDVAGTMQAALDGSYRQPEGLRRQIVTLALQVAKDDQDTVALGKAVDLFMENGPARVEPMSFGDQRAF